MIILLVSLLSILEPFIYDPLVEWTKEPKKKGNNFVPCQTADGKNIQAMININRTRSRLQGIIEKDAQKKKPMSVAGQVNELINEATDPANLSKMFIGWAAFL